MTISWICQCGQETEVTVYPIVPAQTYGPPENCYPESGGESEPGECRHCGAEIPNDAAYEQASVEANHEREAMEEAKAEARQEQRDEERRLFL